MKAETVVNGILTFFGGVSVGWWLRAVSSGDERRSSSSGRKAAGATGKGRPKTGAAAAAGGAKGAPGRPRLAAARPREELKMVLCVNSSLGEAAWHALLHVDACVCAVHARVAGLPMCRHQAQLTPLCTAFTGRYGEG